MSILHVMRVGVAAFVACSAVLGAQRPSRPVDLATLSPDAASVYRTWQTYLASKDGQWSANAGLPSTEWLADEQRRWPKYDLAANYLDDGSSYEVTSVAPVQACGQPRYRITTQFRPRYPVSATTTTATVYAQRNGDRWFLTNALTQLTCSWRRETVGPITYVFAPDYPYQSARARRATAFVDSLASALTVPSIGSVTYYLSANVNDMYRLVGIELSPKVGADAVGGLAQPINRQLFSGHPRIGEEYRHELAHLILAPLCCTRTSFFVSEGVPTWLGGTSGMDFPSAARELSAFLTAHPTVSLDSVISGQYPRVVSYTAGAVLVDMVFAHGGTPALKALFNAGGSAELRRSLEQLFGRQWSVIAREWRIRALSFH